MSNDLDNKHDIEYGWCYTDKKDGKSIREFCGEKARLDFFELSHSKKFIEKALKKYGLPMPKEDEIFRGKDEDILFIDSHGLVIRIGDHQSIERSANPAILQPIHWTEDDNSNMVLSIYPGVHLYNNNEGNYFKTVSLHFIMLCFGNKFFDRIPENIGGIQAMDETGKQMLVKLLIDPSHNDHPYRERASIEVTDPKSLEQSIETLLTNNRCEEYEQSHKIKFNADLYRQAFEYHQPLRHAFRVFDLDDATEEQKRKAWETVRNFKNGGYKIYKKDKSNPQSRRKLVQTRTLETPWTGKK